MTHVGSTAKTLEVTWIQVGRDNARRPQVLLDQIRIPFDRGHAPESTLPVTLALLLPMEQDKVPAAPKDDKPRQEEIDKAVGRLEALLDPKQRLSKEKEATQLNNLLKLMSEMPPALKDAVLKAYNQKHPPEAGRLGLPNRMQHPLNSMTRAIIRLYGPDAFDRFQMVTYKGMQNLAHPENNLKKPLDFVGPHDAQVHSVFDKLLDIPVGGLPEGKTLKDLPLRKGIQEATQGFLKDFQKLPANSPERKRLADSMLALAKAIRKEGVAVDEPRNQFPQIMNDKRFQDAKTDDEKVAVIVRILQEQLDQRKAF